MLVALVICTIIILSGLIYVDYKISELNDNVDKNYEKIVVNTEQVTELRYQIKENNKEISKLSANGTDIPNTKTFHSIVKDVAKFIVHNNETRELSKSLGTDKVKIYNYVRDNIKYNMSSPYERSTNVIKYGEGDCIGKANLLATLFIEAGYTDVRVVIAYVNYDKEIRVHGWVETLDNNGKMIVLDSSQFYGNFEYNEWDVTSYYKKNSVYPIVQYNDQIVDPNLEIIQDNS